MKVVGLMVVGPGEGDRWLGKCLKQWDGLVDDAVICLNNADKKTEEIAKRTGFWVYSDNREWGIHQPRIKSELLKRIGGLKPDWILPRDADEFYDGNFNRNAVERLSRMGRISFAFYIVNLWGDETHYRKELGFFNIRLFKYIPHLTDYERKNLHCGLAPPVFYWKAKDTPYMILHYGLLNKKDREQKYERYQKYDPDRKWKPGPYYDELRRETVGSPFSEEAVRDKLTSLLKWESLKEINS